MISNAGISRSGRVRKKSAKLIEMEDWDSGDGENFTKSRKKSKSFDDSDPDTERKVAPIRIPKPPFPLASGQKKKCGENMAGNKVLPMKIISREGAAMEVKGGSSYMSMNLPSVAPMMAPKLSVLSSSSSESSDSSSDESDSDASYHRASNLTMNMQAHDKLKSKPAPKQMHFKKVEVEKLNTYSANEDSSDFSGSDDSEGDTNDHSLVIAESIPIPKKKKLITKTKQDNKEKSKILKKPKASETDDLDDSPIKKVEQKPKKREPIKKGKKNESKSSRPMTAYMLWGQENRKKIVSQNPAMDFANISRKMGEAWKSLPDKEKMAWKRKAKKAAHKGSTLISTGRPSHHGHAKLISKTNVTNTNKLDDSTRGLNPEGFKTVGTTSLDVAAHLKLLGESLSIIGQRLTEHEGQIAVSGSLSVLLDSTLCALGPLLCLTAQTPELNGCPQETLSQILDNVAYMMPGL